MRALRRFLQQWWSAPVDHLWLRSFVESRSITRLVHGLITGFALGLAVIALALLLTPQGPSGVSGTTIAVLCACVAFGWAVRWAVLPWPSVRICGAFVISADFCIVLLAMQTSRPFIAYGGVLVLSVSGLFVTFFHGPRSLLAHVVWSIAAMDLTLTPLLSGSERDLPLAAVMAVAGGTILIGIPVITHIGLWLIRTDAEAALVDPLTGVFNRRGVVHRVERAVVAGRCSEPQQLVVLALDLDHFKRVNDNYGHAVGDEVLVRTARRLTREARASAIVGRMGGEEFTVVDFMAVDAVRPFAERIRSAVAAPADRAPITASIGTATVAADGVDAAQVSRILDSAWRRADQAMYGAKKLGGNAIDHSVASRSEPHEEPRNEAPHSDDDPPHKSLRDARSEP